MTRVNAIPYNKHHNARTYLIVDNSFLICGYVTLAMACMEIPEGISTSLRRKMQGYGRYSATSVPCFLIGQLAREEGTPERELRLGDILGIALRIIKEAQDLVGGRFILVDCIDKLVSLYEKHGFRKVCKTGELNQMIMFID